MAQQEGRSTPPPNRSRDDLSGLDVAQLLNRHDELRVYSISFRFLRVFSILNKFR